MAGQQQLEILDKEAYYNKAHEELLRQADLYYLQKNFALESNFDSKKMMHAQLYEQILCSENCELMEWIWKKIQGKLEPKRRRKKDFNILVEDIPDININNFFNVESNWEEIQW